MADAAIFIEFQIIHKEKAMFPTYNACNTSILTVNGTEICRIQHESQSFRQSVIDNALEKITPSLVDDIPQKFWSLIKSLVERGMKIDAIKLLKIVVDHNPSLTDAKEAVEFIAGIEIAL
jgi:hypothetical protein